MTNVRLPADGGQAGCSMKTWLQVAAGPEIQPKRLLGVCNRLLASVTTGAIIDLDIGPLWETYDGDNLLPAGSKRPVTVWLSKSSIVGFSGFSKWRRLRSAMKLARPR